MTMKQLLSKGVCIAIALLCVNWMSAQDLWDRKTIASNFHGGNGTVNDPYQIRTGAELMYFVSQVNAGDDFSGKTVKLMNDINMNNDNFTISQTFAGTFDGGGHVLTMMVGVTSNDEPFQKVSGRIHHLGVVISMESQYKGVYYGRISIIGTLNEGGILEDCHYEVLPSASIFYYQPALAYSNYGIIRNCYAGGSFYIYGGYNRDGSLLVRDNFETGIIENCYAYVNNGTTNDYGYRALPLAYTDQGTLSHNSTNVEELNEWVDKHPEHSRWTESDTYKLVDFNPTAVCAVEFIDTLFSSTTPTLSIERGQPIGELATPDVDCTFMGWVRSGQIVTASDIVNSNWTLFAKWEQRIKKQPTKNDLSVKVDDKKHALFQWYAIYGEAYQYGSWQSTNHGSDSESSKTIEVTAKAGQELKFSYSVSSELRCDIFKFTCNGTTILSESGEKDAEYSYIIPEDGTYKFVFSYSKDSDTSQGTDMVVVSNIRLVDLSNELACTQDRLPASLVEKEGLYFCQICYSNTLSVLSTDTLFCIPGEITDPSEFENELFSSDLKTRSGQKVELPIMLTNNSDLSIVGISFNLTLPQGVTIATDEDGTPVYSLQSERLNTKQFSVYANQYDDGSWGIRISANNTTATLNGTEGEFMTLTLKIADDMAEGDYSISLTENKLSIRNTENIVSKVLRNSTSTLTINNVITGDVNSDGEVDLSDAIMVTYYSLKVVLPSFNESAADMNDDGEIDLSDAITIIYMSLGVHFGNNAKHPNRIAASNSDNLQLYGEGGSFCMSLSNEDNYLGFQYDIKLPTGATLTSLNLNDSRAAGHTLMYNQLEDGSYRVAAFSTSGDAFSGNLGELLSFTIDGNAQGAVSIENIFFVDTELRKRVFDDLSAIATGIESLAPALSEGNEDIYNISGQRLNKMQKGINIVKGKKIMK